MSQPKSEMIVFTERKKADSRRVWLHAVSQLWLFGNEWGVVQPGVH